MVTASSAPLHSTTYRYSKWEVRSRDKTKGTTDKNYEPSEICKNTTSITLYDTCVFSNTTNGSVESVVDICDRKRWNCYSVNTGTASRYTSYSSNNSPDAHCSNELKEIRNNALPSSNDPPECTVIGPLNAANNKGTSPSYDPKDMDAASYGDADCTE